MWVPNLFSASPADSTAQVGGRKKEQGTRGCNLKDSAVDFMKHIAQAVPTLRERGKKRKPHELTYNNYFNSNNCWISVRNRLPKSTLTTWKGRGGEGRGEPTHLRNQIQMDKETVSYSCTWNNKLGKIKGGAFQLSQSNNKNMPIIFSFSHPRFSLQKTLLPKMLFVEPKGIILEIQFKELRCFQTGFVHQAKESNEGS